MIYIDDSHIKIGGVVLPGIYKSLEIKTDAQVEEQEVEGSAAKPKQAIGYEDAKVTIELTLEDGTEQTKEDKLAIIQSIFRRKGQVLPKVQEIINQHTYERGVTQVIFKSLSTKDTNKKEEIAVSIELWEYVPMTINAKKGNKSSGKSSPSGLSNEYNSYLDTRGAAPKLSNKTSQSPAIDNRGKYYEK